MADSSSIRERRKCIPFRPDNAGPNYFKLLKGAVGSKDVSKSAMPVEFNEPLSMLQRQTEELEYGHLLDLAALEQDPNRKMAFICTFAISAYSTVGSRPTKPFNPLLGETYECDRRVDRGWRSLAEQISHHPPGSALHVEGQAWTLEQQYAVESKLKGTSFWLNPVGGTTIKCHGDCYAYGKLPTSTSFESILNWSGKNGGSSGRASTECAGELTVTNLGKGAKGMLTFHGDKKGGANSRRVTGIVLDGGGKEMYWIEAIWDKWARISRKCPIKGESDPEAEQIWTVNELAPDWQRMHNFTQFAIELNEYEEAGIAPTDSRCRPDQRLCEMGEFGAANRVKKCLEEAQRQRQREWQQKGKEYRPLWFSPKASSNGTTANRQFAFNGQYWRAKEAQNWDPCPELFAV